LVFRSHLFHFPPAGPPPPQVLLRVFASVFLLTIKLPKVSHRRFAPLSHPLVNVHQNPSSSSCAHCNPRRLRRSPRARQYPPFSFSIDSFTAGLLLVVDQILLPQILSDPTLNVLSVAFRPFLCDSHGRPSSPILGLAQRVLPPLFFSVLARPHSRPRFFRKIKASVTFC